MPSRRGLELDQGERLRYRGDLRTGGEIAVTERRMLVYGDEGVTSVPYDNVSEVATENFNWFLAILSGALILFGIYSLERQVLVGVACIAFGCWSLYRSYRHRDRVRIHTQSQPKPVEVFPEDVESLYAELEPAIETVRATDEREAEAG